MNELYADEIEYLRDAEMNKVHSVDIEELEPELTRELEPDEINESHYCGKDDLLVAKIMSSTVGYDELDPIIDPLGLIKTDSVINPLRLVESNDSEGNDSIIRLEAALDKTAPTIDAEFTLPNYFLKQFPGSSSNHHHEASLTTIALSMMLMAVSGLLGSKVRKLILNTVHLWPTIFMYGW